MATPPATEEAAAPTTKASADAKTPVESPTVPPTGEETTGDEKKPIEELAGSEAPPTAEASSPSTSTEVAKTGTAATTQPDTVPVTMATEAAAGTAQSKVSPVTTPEVAADTAQEVSPSVEGKVAQVPAQPEAASAVSPATTPVEAPKTVPPLRIKKPKPAALMSAKGEEKPATSVEALKTPTSATDFQAKFLEFSKRKSVDIPGKDEVEAESKPDAVAVETAAVSSSTSAADSGGTTPTTSVGSMDAPVSRETTPTAAGDAKMETEESKPEAADGQAEKKESDDSKDEKGLPMQVDGAWDSDSDECGSVCFSPFPLQLDGQDDQEAKETGPGLPETGSGQETGQAPPQPPPGAMMGGVMPGQPARMRLPAQPLPPSVPMPGGTGHPSTYMGHAPPGQMRMPGQGVPPPYPTQGMRVRSPLASPVTVPGSPLHHMVHSGASPSPWDVPALRTVTKAQPPCLYSHPCPSR